MIQELLSLFLFLVYFWFIFFYIIYCFFYFFIVFNFFSIFSLEVKKDFSNRDTVKYMHGIILI